jgi:hypothetical protein
MIFGDFIGDNRLDAILQGHCMAAYAGFAKPEWLKLASLQAAKTEKCARGWLGGIFRVSSGWLGGIFRVA